MMRISTASTLHRPKKKPVTAPWIIGLVQSCEPPLLACRLIKEFEREARTDGVPAAELASRKKALVQELNSFIAMKKDRSGDLEARKELALTTRNSSPEKAYAGTTGAD